MRAERRAVRPRERIDEPEARVVAREPVLGTGIAQSDDDLQRSAGHVVTILR